ncbi:MAG TPA: undecaprenyl-diphosphate phosphatase [Acidobacteriota bacterium]|nr:undecaprenyl-diphosphate phosphatase [Acidobacteriota bacterium]
MSLWEAIVLGVVQGATEFLPVSSSGHLVLISHAFGWADDSIAFEVAVHGGTLAAVLMYFRARLLTLTAAVFTRGHSAETVRESRRLMVFLVVGSIPAAVVGLALKIQIESAFAAPRLTAAFLIFTGILLLAMHRWSRPRGTLTTARTWWIGCAQAVAILPGISRSGATIATGSLLGVPAAKAAEFSFLLSIPAVAGAAMLELPDAVAAGQFGLADVVGAVTAGLTGYLALSLVFAALRRGRFVWFGIYCLVIGAAAAILLR